MCDGFASVVGYSCMGGFRDLFSIMGGASLAKLVGQGVKLADGICASTMNIDILMSSNPKIF